jgi:hypothetical protein
LVSALDGSKGAVRDSVTGLPSSTGPLFPNVAVGETLPMLTVALYSVSPPSLSITLPFTVRLPLSSVGQLAAEAELAGA